MRRRISWYRVWRNGSVKSAKRQIRKKERKWKK